MAQRVLSAVVIIVALLLLAALGLAVYRAATGQPVLPASGEVALGGTEGDIGPADAGADDWGAADTTAEPPEADTAAEMVKLYALASLPGWQAEVARHDDEWRSATVRAKSPDGKASLDIDLVWDQDLADYVVVAARAAGVQAPAPKPGAGDGLPAGVKAAIDGHAKLGKLAGRTLRLDRLTSADALVVVKAGSAAWRVYLKRRGEQWAIINARQLTQ